MPSMAIPLRYWSLWLNLIGSCRRNSSCSVITSLGRQTLLLSLDADRRAVEMSL